MAQPYDPRTMGGFRSLPKQVDNKNRRGKVARFFSTHFLWILLVVLIVAYVLTQVNWGKLFSGTKSFVGDTVNTTFDFAREVTEDTIDLAKDAVNAVENVIGEGVGVVGSAFSGGYTNSLYTPEILRQF